MILQISTKAVRNEVQGYRPRNLDLAMTNGSLLGDIQLLAVEGSSENGMDSATLEKLKIGLDPLVSQSIDDVLKVSKHKQLQKMTKYELSQFTHVISNTIEFPNYDTITDKLMIPVVTTQWVKDVIKNKRVVPLRSYSPDPRHFFRDTIVAAGGGLHDDDKEILKVAVKAFGGIYLEDLKKSLTHFVTNDLEDDSTKLIMAFNEYNPSGKIVQIVKVDWVFDSIKEGRILPESSYALDLISSNEHENGKAIGTEKPDFLSGTNFKISDNLEVSDNLKSHFAAFSNGEKDRDSVYLTRYLNTDLDISCKQRTFDYFFSLLFHKNSKLPFDSLLFHPVNRTSVDGMSDTLIATTNYTGDSRIYIEELATRMGGKFSKTMKSANTHLVASKSVGKKFEFANTWNVKIVNHMWVEDSFVNWKIMDVSDYKALPRDTKGVRFIGDVKFNGFLYDEKANEPEQMIGEVNADTKTGKSDEKCAEVNVNQSELSESKTPTFHEVSQAESKRETYTSDGAAPLENSKVVEKEDTKEEDKKEKETEKPKTKEEDKISKTASPKVDSRVRTRTRKELKKEELQVEKMEGLEKIEKPKKRGKATKQADEVKEPDAIWEIPEDVTTSEKPKSAKRKASASIEDSDEKEKSSKKVAKKPVKSDKPYDITAIVTGFDGTLSVGDKRELKKVGITIVENANKNINCIIAPSLLRTQKFLTALSYSPEYLLEPLFLSDVLGTLDSVRKIGDFESISPKVEKYDIWEHVDFDKDIQPKRLFRKKTTREQAIEYMKKSRNGLLEGFVFNLSPGLAGGFDTLKSILKSFGCKQCVLFKENTKTAVANGEKSVNGVSDVAILICTPAEKKVQKHFTEVCKGSKTKYVVLEWDAIVTAIFEAALDLKSAKVLLQNGVL